MPAPRFTTEIACCPHWRRRLHRQVQAELNQAWQNAACVATHLFEPRLACWLLMMADRADARQVDLTHEHLGDILNVRRESVTAACGSLRRQGLIGYHRGTISILDRAGIEQASCGCYRPIDRGVARQAATGRSTAAS
jgi:CRP-like cAMP-binding protein